MKKRFGRGIEPELEPEPVELQDKATEDSSELVEGIEAVRLRPAMYVGWPDSNGLYQLFSEIIDNAVGEVKAGYATRISVMYGADHSLAIQDNGRGIPIEIEPQTGKQFSELIFTEFLVVYPIE